MFSLDRVTGLLAARLGADPVVTGDDAVFELDGGLRLAVRRVPGADWGVAWTAPPLPAASGDAEAEKGMREALRLALGRLYRAPEVVLTRAEEGGAPVLYVRLRDGDEAKCIERINRLLNEAEMYARRLGGAAARTPKAQSAAALFAGLHGAFIRP